MPSLSDGQHVYCFANWPGSISLDSASATSSVTIFDSMTQPGGSKLTSQAVAHSLEAGGFLQVMSHFSAVGGYDGTKEWVSINPCLYEATKMLDAGIGPRRSLFARMFGRVSEHEYLVGCLQQQIWFGKNPWKQTAGTVDGQQVFFEAVSIGSSFAAITQVGETVISIYSHGVGIRPLELVRYKQTKRSDE